MSEPRSFWDRYDEDSDESSEEELDEEAAKELAPPPNGQASWEPTTIIAVHASAEWKRIKQSRVWRFRFPLCDIIGIALVKALSETPDNACVLVFELDKPIKASNFAKRMFDTTAGQRGWKQAEDWTPQQMASSATRHYIHGDEEQLIELLRYLCFLSGRIKSMCINSDDSVTNSLDPTQEELHPREARSSRVKVPLRIRPPHFAFVHGTHDRLGTDSPIRRLAGCENALEIIFMHLEAALPNLEEEEEEEKNAALQRTRDAVEALIRADHMPRQKENEDSEAHDPEAPPSDASIEAKIRECASDPKFKRSGSKVFVLKSLIKAFQSHKGYIQKVIETRKIFIDERINFERSLQEQNFAPCALAAVHAGHIDLEKGLDQVLLQSDCLMSCGATVSCTLRDALYQPSHGDYYSEDGDGAALKCDDSDCGMNNYISGLCTGEPRIATGKSHNHCVECPGFGTCIGDMRNEHCHACGEHYFAGNSGFGCHCGGFRAAEKREKLDKAPPPAKWEGWPVYLDPENKEKITLAMSKRVASLGLQKLKMRLLEGIAKGQSPEELSGLMQIVALLEGCEEHEDENKEIEEARSQAQEANAMVSLNLLQA